MVPAIGYARCSNTGMMHIAVVNMMTPRKTVKPIDRFGVIKPRRTPAQTRGRTRKACRYEGLSICSETGDLTTRAADTVRAVIARHAVVLAHGPSALTGIATLISPTRASKRRSAFPAVCETGSIAGSRAAHKSSISLQPGACGFIGQTPRIMPQTRRGRTFPLFSPAPQ